MTAVRELETNFLVDSFYITLFDILQGLIFSLLLLVFLTALFSPTVKRSKTCPPPVALCTFQSAGIYSSNPFVTSAAFALVFELFIKLKAALNRTGPLSVKWSWGLVIFPVVVYVIVFIWVIAVGISHPSLVELDGTHMFCHIIVSQEIGLAQPFVVSATVTLLAEILVVVFSVWTNIILFNHKRKTGEFLSENSSPFSMSAFIRRNALMAALTTIRDNILCEFLSPQLPGLELRLDGDANLYFSTIWNSNGGNSFCAPELNAHDHITRIFFEFGFA
ncbi:hypothetical protein ARMSODRAFT_1020948 [Armillaria solidipes]|uniref:Uncharacterized protein n=1 Tax=Armillaria solidipes TaxID=1076256 RepID=A0A2H3BBC6_9AGAR|nr:hypothetical protein ARMSODRAFT_1020948 [Armillaria solidipes]